MEALRKLRDEKAMDGIHERFGDMGEEVVE